MPPPGPHEWDVVPAQSPGVGEYAMRERAPSDRDRRSSMNYSYLPSLDGGLASPQPAQTPKAKEWHYDRARDHVDVEAQKVTLKPKPAGPRAKGGGRQGGGQGGPHYLQRRASGSGSGISPLVHNFTSPISECPRVMVRGIELMMRFFFADM